MMGVELAQVQRVMDLVMVEVRCLRDGLSEIILGSRLLP